LSNNVILQNNFANFQLVLQFMANYGKLELIFTLFLITNFQFLTHIKKYFSYLEIISLVCPSSDLMLAMFMSF